MGCITFVLLVLNIIALVAIDIMFWAESAASGLAGVFGIIAFFIGYALSVEVTIAPKRFLGKFCIRYLYKETWCSQYDSFCSVVYRKFDNWVETLK